MKLVTLATCNLDQWAMDFEGNLKRIIESIRYAKKVGARFRLGPELEISGYGCEDHFYEVDTYTHSMECLAEILKSDVTDDMLVDIGMHVIHKTVRYNARVLLCNRKVVFIRPKLYLADDGNYREPRFFAAWTKTRTLEDFILPPEIQKITGQKYVPIGDAIVRLNDTEIASETCEELFTPKSPHIALGLDGAEIITNGSGSHHQLRKLHTRVNLIQNASRKIGGVYVYANQQGCDGSRLYFDGSCMIAMNGHVLAQGSQFSLSDVEVVTSTVDLDEIRSFRNANGSRQLQAAQTRLIYPRVNLDFSIVSHEFSPLLKPSKPLEVSYLLPEQEIALGPACWLWDYVRRSNMGGFFLPLSGGADSSATATIVGSMCKLVFEQCERAAGNSKHQVNELQKQQAQVVLKDLRRLLNVDEKWHPKSPKDIANYLFYTCYMGTCNSSEETKQRAEKLASEIGAYHLSIQIDPVVNAMTKLFTCITGKIPKFKAHGGTYAENIALQNIQARLRMVTAYFLSQLLTWTRGLKGNKTLLVLGSANVDEALRGYYTKYDCSSADLNPIGSISKVDLRKFLYWASTHLSYPSLRSVVEAPPTAELEPLSSNQTDEQDMGMTYQELSHFGALRKLNMCGPVGMFKKLTHEWGANVPVHEVATKVKRFFRYYSINRHKMTTLTPSYHAENYSPDDNRYDLRQFLYNVDWPWQFSKIDALADKYSSQMQEQTLSVPTPAPNTANMTENATGIFTIEGVKKYTPATPSDDHLDTTPNTMKSQ